MKKSRLIISILIAIFGIISAFVLMAEPFGKSYELGSGFLVIFGEDNWNYNVVAPLMIAFFVEMVCVLLPFASIFLSKKLAKIIYGAGAVLDIVCGVLMLLALQLFVAANSGKTPDVEFYSGLGPAFISNAVMVFIAAAIGLVGVLLVNRED
ncbi:MAG: hypothetical protein IJ247_00240 [Bacilli bacterium]|nr:hypothetical protein [Bacilli bacterium]